MLMIEQTIIRLKAGIAEKRFTQKTISDLSGVSQRTIQQMRQDGWLGKTIDNVKKINAALDELEAEHAEASS